MTHTDEIAYGEHQTQKKRLLVGPTVQLEISDTENVAL